MAMINPTGLDNHGRPLPPSVRPYRPYPAIWEDSPFHTVPFLPTEYPALLSLPAITAIPASALETAFCSPQLTRPPTPDTERAYNALAEYGKCIVRSTLISICTELRVCIGDYEHVVECVGNTRVLAQVSLESGVLDAAMKHGTRNTPIEQVTCETAAGVFQAVAAVIRDAPDPLLGAASLKAAMYPWAERTIVRLYLEHTNVPGGTVVPSELRSFGDRMRQTFAFAAGHTCRP